LPQVIVENVSKRYQDVTALERVSLSIDHGEYVSIIGPSGCGKTTLLRCIAGIIEPDEGEISVDGRPLIRVPPEKRNLGYMFQEIALFPHMNTRENAGYGPRVRGYSTQRVRSIANDTLEMVNLVQQSSAYPFELSGGAKQKVALARAIGSAPSLLLLDEPLGSLDTSVRVNLRLELRRLVKELGLTAVHVTHDQEEAMSISDRLVIMRDGRIIEVGKPHELYLNPKEVFTANFLGEANFLMATVISVGSNDMTLDIQGERIEIPVRTIPKEVVVAIRPQFVRIARSGPKILGGWEGRIVDKKFLGDSVRFELDFKNGLRMIAQIPLNVQYVDVNVGEKISANFQRDKILTFARSTQGLEKELSTG